MRHRAPREHKRKQPGEPSLESRDVARLTIHNAVISL